MCHRFSFSYFEVRASQDINLFSCHLRRGHFKTLNTAFMRTKTLRRLNLGEELQVAP